MLLLVLFYPLRVFITTGQLLLYTFITDDDDWWYSIPVTVPAGEYNIDFDGPYSGTFEYGVHNSAQTRYRYGQNTYTWYNAIITDEETNLTIEY